MAPIATGTLDGFSAGDWALLVGFTVVAAIVAYRVAIRFRLRAGTPPWRIPPGGWVAIMVLSPLIGLVLLAIAVRTTRPRSLHVVPAGPPVVPGPPAPLPLAGWYPDPSGRFLTRYWDGRYWSDQVHDGVTVSSDPPSSWSSSAGQPAPGGPPPAG